MDNTLTREERAYIDSFAIIKKPLDLGYDGIKFDGRTLQFTHKSKEWVMEVTSICDDLGIDWQSKEGAEIIKRVFGDLEGWRDMPEFE